MAGPRKILTANSRPKETFYFDVANLPLDLSWQRFKDVLKMWVNERSIGWASDSGVRITGALEAAMVYMRITSDDNPICGGLIVHCFDITNDRLKIVDCNCHPANLHQVHTTDILGMKSLNSEKAQASCASSRAPMPLAPVRNDVVSPQGHRVLPSRTSTTTSSASSALGGYIVTERRSILIRGLPYKSTHEEICAYLQPLAGFLSCKMPRSTSHKSSGRGHAVASFKTSAYAVEAVLRLNGSSFGGRQLHVEVAAEATSVMTSPEPIQSQPCPNEQVANQTQDVNPDGDGPRPLIVNGSNPYR